MQDTPLRDRIKDRMQIMQNEEIERHNRQLLESEKQKITGPRSFARAIRVVSMHNEFSRVYTRALKEAQNVVEQTTGLDKETKRINILSRTADNLEDYGERYLEEASELDSKNAERKHNIAYNLFVTAANSLFEIEHDESLRPLGENTFDARRFRLLAKAEKSVDGKIPKNIATVLPYM
jgi:hypothetical protein